MAKARITRGPVPVGEAVEVLVDLLDANDQVIEERIAVRVPVEHGQPLTKAVVHKAMRTALSKRAESHETASRPSAVLRVGETFEL